MKQKKSIAVNFDYQPKPFWLWKEEYYVCGTTYVESRMEMPHKIGGNQETWLYLVLVNEEMSCAVKCWVFPSIVCELGASAGSPPLLIPPS